MKSISNNKHIKGSIINSKNNVKSKINNTKKPIVADNRDLKIKFDFSLYQPFSIKSSTFTNFYSNPDDYIKMFQSLIEMIDYFKNFSESEILNNKNHSHRITEDKIKCVENIIKIYKIDFASKNLEFEHIYQIGLKGALRIIGIFETICGQTKFFPLFCDPHHLIYPDCKHNKYDTDKFSYCNLNSSVDNSFINLIDINSFPTEKCYECKYIK